MSLRQQLAGLTAGMRQASMSWQDLSAAMTRLNGMVTQRMGKGIAAQPGPGVYGYSEGGEFDFAVGSLHGLRMWNMGPDGGLTGSFGMTWADGENVASCQKNEDQTGLVLVCATVQAFAHWCRDMKISPNDERIRRVSSLYDVDGHPADSKWIEVKDGFMPMPQLARVRKALDDKYAQVDYHRAKARLKATDSLHDIPGPHSVCGCGFWAYWTPGQARSVYLPDRPVLGIVEGYGKTRIGDKGFRAAKARIVALCVQFDWDAQTPAEVMNLRSMTEDRIMERYPSAKMYCTTEAMLVMHPPTKDYLPEPAPPPRPKLPKFVCAANIGLDSIDVKHEMVDVTPMGSAIPVQVRTMMKISATHDDGTPCRHVDDALAAGAPPFVALAAGQPGGYGNPFAQGGPITGGRGGNVTFHGGAGGSGSVAVAGGGGGGSGRPPGGSGLPPGIGGSQGGWSAAASPAQMQHAIGWGLTHHPNGTPRAIGGNSSVSNYP